MSKKNAKNGEGQETGGHPTPVTSEVPLGASGGATAVADPLASVDQNLENIETQRQQIVDKLLADKKAASRQISGINQRLVRLGVSVDEDEPSNGTGVIRRGRPKGSKNKVAGRIGRPKGSVNKAGRPRGENKTKMIEQVVIKFAPNKSKAKTSRELGEHIEEDELREYLSPALQAMGRARPPRVGIIKSPKNKRGTKYYAM